MDNPNYQAGMRLVRAKQYIDLGQIQNAISVYKYAISQDPDDLLAHNGLAHCHLLTGDFQRGWLEYEWRLTKNQIKLPLISSPRWDGRPLEGKTIILLAEQGAGDMIQFVRYAEYVKAKHGNVILVCSPNLARLAANCKGTDRVVAMGSGGEILHDFHVPLMSLPGIFQTTLNTIPSAVPYLHPPKEAVKTAKEILADYKNTLRVGLVWKGSTQKSLMLNQFKELLGIPRIKIFSLQKGQPVSELEYFTPGSITDLGQSFEDFADTAAAIEELDLVISVDTAVTHLAGALGKPVWTLLPFAPDWRWMLNREDSPWYPTMRLFRQPVPGDWASVIKRVSEELKALVAAK
jgi:tetratricopeptide (TPR) repeat protein